MSTHEIQIDASDPLFPFTRFILWAPAPDFQQGEFDATVAQTVRLQAEQPIRFQFQSGVLSDWSFSVDADGRVAYDAAWDVERNPEHGFLAGLGTPRLKLVGYETTIDARSLSGGLATFRGTILGERFEFIGLQTLHLLPQRGYQLIQGSGSAPDFRIEVTLPGKGSPGGTIDYDPVFDVCGEPPGFLAGRGTRTLRLLGRPICVSACALEFPLISNVQQIQIDRGGMLVLLPGAWYRLSAAHGPGNATGLDFYVDLQGEVTRVRVTPIDGPGPSAPLDLGVERRDLPCLKVVAGRS